MATEYAKTVTRLKTERHFLNFESYPLNSLIDLSFSFLSYRNCVTAATTANRQKGSAVTYSGASNLVLSKYDSMQNGHISNATITKRLVTGL
jgi:hypothetical protein